MATPNRRCSGSAACASGIKIRKMAAGRPRLSVHRSNKNISVQLIDDGAGVTLAAASTLEPGLGVVGQEQRGGRRQGRRGDCRTGQGQAGVEAVYFDRGGFLYHGRVKALADAAREGGLKF
jgi:large subunit ribosomal protein L18